MPDYSEYIILKNKKLEFYNHYRGDYTFLCDMFWGEKEAKRIIGNQKKSDEFKGDNPLSRIIINEDKKEISFQLSVFEDKKGEGILALRKYLELVNLNWVGWKVNYLKEGYDDVIRFLSKHKFDEAKKGLENVNSYVPNYIENAWDEPKGTLISKEHGGKVRYEFVEKNIAEIIVKGEKLLELELKNEIINDRLPFGGIHIYQDSKKLKIWYVIEPTKLQEWTTKYWKDWHIEFQFWGYDNHYKLLGLEDKLSDIKKILGKIALKNIKDQIVNTEKEPYFEENRIYSFRNRKFSKSEMIEKFDKIFLK